MQDLSVRVNKSTVCAITFTTKFTWNCFPKAFLALLIPPVFWTIGAHENVGDDNRERG